MRCIRPSIGLAILLAGTSLLPACQIFAQEIDFHGYAEGAVVSAPDTLSWRDGGLGKLPWGGTGSSDRTSAELVAAVLETTVSLPPDLSFHSDLRYALRQRSGVDLLDAALTWRPP